MLTTVQLGIVRRAPDSPFVFGEKHVICLECGVFLSSLYHHLRKMHLIDAGVYRQCWQLPPDQPLLSGRVHRRFQEHRAHLLGRPHLRPVAVPAVASVSIEHGPAYRSDILPEEVAAVRASGVTMEALARRYSTTCSLIRRRLREAGAAFEHPPNYRDDISPEAVRAARDSGLTYAEASRHFQCSESVIRARLKTAGVQLANQGPRTPTYRRDVSTAQVESLYAAGLTYRQIADQLRCAPGMVRRRLLEAGILIPRAQRHPEPCHECGKPVKSIILHLARGHDGMKPADYWARWGRPRRKRPRPKRERVLTLPPKTRSAGATARGKDSVHYRHEISPEQIMDLAAQGFSITEIAQLLHCDRSTLRRRIREDNLPLRGRRGSRMRGVQ